MFNSRDVAEEGWQAGWLLRCSLASAQGLPAHETGCHCQMHEIGEGAMSSIFKCVTKPFIFPADVHLRFQESERDHQLGKF